ATVLALPARALPRCARPTAVPLQASLNDRHRGAEIPALTSPAIRLRHRELNAGFPFVAAALRPALCRRATPAQKLSRPRVAIRAIAIPDATVTGISTSLGKGWQKRRKYQTPLSAVIDAPRPRRPLEFFPKWCAKTPARRRTQLFEFLGRMVPRNSDPGR